MLKETSVHVRAASTSPKVSDVSTTSTIVTTTTTTTTPKAKGIVMQEPEGTTIRTIKIVPSQSSKKLDEKVEAKEDNDQEKVDMKMYMKIVSDDEIAIDAIPLATKPQIIKLVKDKYGNTRPEEAYERVLWVDLKVMFEPDIEKKRYPLTPATITEMLNWKLQADHDVPKNRIYYLIKSFFLTLVAVQSSQQWLLFSSSSGNFLHWQWKLPLAVGTL
nr:hypothetical protein [Tanacetum cinerariifolium]